VSAPSRLGESVAGKGIEDCLYGGIQTDPIALRNIDRRHAMSGPHDCADLLASIEERFDTPSTFGGHPVRAHQEAFRAADRGEVEQQAQMTRDPKATRMGKAVPVANQAVRPRLEFGPGLDDGSRNERSPGMYGNRAVAAAVAVSSTCRPSALMTTTPANIRFEA